MNSKHYGILSFVSLLGLCYSFFGGTAGIIGAIVIALTNGFAVSMALKENKCNKNTPTDSTAVATPVAES